MSPPDHSLVRASAECSATQGQRLGETHSIPPSARRVAQPQDVDAVLRSQTKSPSTAQRLRCTPSMALGPPNT